MIKFISLLLVIFISSIGYSDLSKDKLFQNVKPRCGAENQEIWNQIFTNIKIEKDKSLVTNIFNLYDKTDNCSSNQFAIDVFHIIKLNPKLVIESLKDIKNIKTQNGIFCYLVNEAYYINIHDVFIFSEKLVYENPNNKNYKWFKKKIHVQNKKMIKKLLN